MDNRDTSDQKRNGDRRLLPEFTKPAERLWKWFFYVQLILLAGIVVWWIATMGS